MRTTIAEDRQGVTLAPSDGAADAAVIWLHGLGADGHDFLPIVTQLALPASARIRFVFPHAKVRPVTLNNGMAMRAWYDIKGLGPGSEEDRTGIEESARRVAGLIAREREDGIPASRIVIAGFSQGGAIALHIGLRHPEALAGVLALSTYLPLAAFAESEASNTGRRRDIMMCHGRQDSVVPFEYGRSSRDRLTAIGCAVHWHEYPMAHEVCADQIRDISAWLAAGLGADRSDPQRK